MKCWFSTLGLMVMHWNERGKCWIKSNVRKLKGGTMTDQLTEGDLAQFTGTENWYRHSLMHKVSYTDGAKHVADTGGAYWLLDIIATMQLEPKVKKEPFQVWKLVVNETHNGVVTCEDGNGNEVYRQVMHYTDFPLKEIKFYFCDNVIHLPSEY